MSFLRWLLPRSGPDRFAREVMGRLRAAGIRDAHYHRDQFAIEYRPRADREAIWMYLGNLYAECQRDPTNRVDRIERFVATFVAPPSMPQTWEEARSLLRPVLRGASFGRGTAMGKRSVLRRPALPYLDELVVVDQPTSMGYVTEGMWDVPGEQVFAEARANLAAVPRPRLDDGPFLGPSIMTFFDTGDAYFVSRLLVDGWLAALADQVGGQPVAFIPDPTSLVVASDDAETLEPLFEAASQEYTEAARPLSPMGYTVDSAGRLAPYVVESDHPLADMVARAERTLATAEYETQRSVLQEEATSSGYLIAGCVMATRDDRTVVTVAAWERLVPTLLPVVDYVAIDQTDSHDDQPLFVPFQALLDEDLLFEAVEYRPTRYRVEQEAREDVLTRLAGRSVRL